ncbi:Brp/Blh family beta-carotene 15,15'-dioxygenase [Hymenobacter weizhouensis]|uniref:Brp/Blh family beta-carotene 15,15'-dioxygenase n=1 Tax=Hymenobacter sp. YIM 151500-1 TaxID=2987689 RepID=UPI002225F896|nr:Brp/Blh family beta-carotene 15,15'-dioxygenase [Hymenobacter sp. YIM 151500-1]UYZ62817.1 Brp/Blh family beta-carotene 15,15'-dioxygenase [Hymenobacter sp. YIM 151500-1]
MAIAFSDYRLPATGRAYSYVALAVAGVVGVLLPTAATLLLGPPLLVGLLVLGLAHGACDQFVVPGRRATVGLGSWRYLLAFGGAYLGLAGVVVGLWWCWPGVAVGLFFLLSAWHWGSADAPPQPGRPAWWVAHSWLRGLLLFAVPLAAWPTETQGVVQELLRLVGAAPVPAVVLAQVRIILVLAVGAGLLAVWAACAARREHLLWRTDAADVLVLTFMLAALPPVLSVGVYFVFWHSLQHVLRMTPLLGYSATQPGRLPGWTALGRQVVFFLRRAWPLLAVSVLALGVLYYWLAPHLPTPAALFSGALVVASVVTLPHALLVSLVLDEPQWARQGSTSSP